MWVAPPALAWADPAAPGRPRRGEVQVWRVTVPPEDLPLGLARCLDDGERARADRFRFPRDRRSYVASHAALRAILGLCIGLPAAALRFAPGEHGKPALLGSAADLAFNLSHSGDLALIAVAAQPAVGVDVEAVREPGPEEELAPRIFSAGELALWERLDAAARKASFFAAWALKEACVKAMGAGLSFPVRELEVLAAGPAGAVGCRTKVAAAGARWSLVPFLASPGYAGAVAVRGAPPAVRPYRWSWPARP
jgi:4'-phosphopantetheinyl transferase